MGHHIDSEGRFQSDKYPDLAPDKIVLSFHDPIAAVVLGYYAAGCKDRDLGRDIEHRLRMIRLRAEAAPLSVPPGVAPVNLFADVPTTCIQCGVEVKGVHCVYCS